MKAIFIISILFVYVDSFSQKLPDVLYWSHDRKLQWSDFRGDTSVASNYDAICPSTLTYSTYTKGTKLEFIVECFFICKLAWAKDTFSKYLLKHEQGHFDITHLFALQLEIAFRTSNFDMHTYHEDMSHMFDVYEMERSKIQAKYDDETSHSLNEEKQKEWDRILAFEIEKHERIVSKLRK